MIESHDVRGLAVFAKYSHITRNAPASGLNAYDLLHQKQLLMVTRSAMDWLRSDRKPAAAVVEAGEALRKQN